MDFLQLHRDDLREGLRSADEAFRNRHAKWIAAQQGPGGGFLNRRGREELYYTTFGLRSLSIMDALAPSAAESGLVFLKQPPPPRRNAVRGAVQAVSWWDAYALCVDALGESDPGLEIERVRQKTCDELDALRRDDGGWAKTPMEGHGSLYHTFLAACVYARMGLPIPDAEKADAFTDGMARADGGFLENRYSKRPGVNGTAAGIALRLMRMGQGAIGKATPVSAWSKLPDLIKKGLTRDLSRHGRFLLTLLNDEGGFQATPNAPFADLLSSYTGLFSLRALGMLEKDVLQGVARFARTLELSDGGYVGFTLEQDADCEYTFYGIGVERIAMEIGV